MLIKCELNSKEFVITVISNDKNFLKSGFLCTCGEIKSEVKSSLSAAVKTYYQIIFDTKIEYSGLTVIGFENEDIIQQLIVDISFFPIFLCVKKFLVVIVGLGNSLKNEYYRARVGFISSFIIRYH